MKKQVKYVAMVACSALLLNSCAVYDYPMYTSASVSVGGHGWNTTASWTNASYDVNGFPIFGYYYGQPVYGYTAAGAAVFSFAALTAACLVPSWGPAAWYCGHWHYPPHVRRVSAPPHCPPGHHPGRRPAHHVHVAAPHRPGHTPHAGAVHHRPVGGHHAAGAHRPALKPGPGVQHKPGVNHRPGVHRQPVSQRPGAGVNHKPAASHKPAVNPRPSAAVQRLQIKERPRINTAARTHVRGIGAAGHSRPAGGGNHAHRGGGGGGRGGHRP